MRGLHNMAKRNAIYVIYTVLVKRKLIYEYRINFVYFDYLLVNCNHASTKFRSVSKSKKWIIKERVCAKGEKQ